MTTPKPTVGQILASRVDDLQRQVTNLQKLNASELSNSLNAQRIATTLSSRYDDLLKELGASSLLRKIEQCERDIKAHNAYFDGKIVDLGDKVTELDGVLESMANDDDDLDVYLEEILELNKLQDPRAVEREIVNDIAPRQPSPASSPATLYYAELAGKRWAIIHSHRKVASELAKKFAEGKFIDWVGGVRQFVDNILMESDPAEKS